jgi:hypothetical protein
MVKSTSSSSSSSSFVLPILFSLYVTLLPLQVVVAQQQEQCNNATTCLDCLTTDGCDAWSVGSCLESCASAPQDVSCYSSEFFLNQTAQEICTVHDTQMANAALCAAVTDCGSCVTTLLADGASVCQWFETTVVEEGGVGFCNSQCTMDGCGVTTCSVDNNNTTTTSTNVCASATTCQECFSQEGCDAWSNGVCFVNCTVAPPDATTCYTTEGLTNSTMDDVCAADTANEELCSVFTDCSSCVFTELLDTGFCQWLDQDGLCASKCRFDLEIDGGVGGGCGVTSCSEVTSLTCGIATSCVECLSLTECGAWSVGECFSTCNNAPQDTSCYSTSITAFSNQTTAEICAVADLENADMALCQPIADCGTCVSTALTNGSGEFCQWFEEEGFCDVGCGETGCGVTTCTDLSMLACVNITGCGQCLGQEGCGAWSSLGDCFSDCSALEEGDTCYSIAAFPNQTSREICRTARDVKSCAGLSDCGTCTGTVLSDGASVCHWFAEQGVCANDCDTNNGCGVTSCPVDCSTLSGCFECLRPGGCNFAGGKCLADCSDAPADTTCYGSELFPNQGPNEICTIFKAERSNTELCTGIPNCGACVATALVNNGGTCQWFDEEQVCSHECNDASGDCGVTTCVDCQAANSCVDCLSLEGCDGWAIGACFKKCDVLPDDTVCYSTSSDPDKTPQEICDGAEDDAANDKICAVKFDCGSCVETLLLGNVSTCQWYANPKFCGSRDLFNGNGTTTCSGGGSIHGGVFSLFLASGITALAYFWITLVVDSLL